MPLFFIISGILHQIRPFSVKEVLQLAVSLLVPYLIYNAIGILHLYITQGVAVLPLAIDCVLGMRMIVDTTWFFLALFLVKFYALFLSSKKALLAFALLCLLLCWAYDWAKIESPHHNVFMLHTSLGAFPFFVLGYLLKDLLSAPRALGVSVVAVVSLLLFSLLMFYFFGTSNIYYMQYQSLFVFYASAIGASFSVLIFSQLVVPYLHFSFIKDISRGTMLIVGLHTFFISQAFPDILFVVMGPRKVFLFAGLLLLFFYIVIKFTYRRIPILYGRVKIQ